MRSASEIASIDVRPRMRRPIREWQGKRLFSEKGLSYTLEAVRKAANAKTIAHRVEATILFSSEWSLWAITS